MDKQLKEINPPKWADRFFEWYCNPDMQEEIQGDLYESFMDRVENNSLHQAKFWYWFQVVLFINRHTLSRKNQYSNRLNSVDMFRNYFKTGYRNIFKNKLTTLINALGMSLAIGCCMVVFLYGDWLYNMDDFHNKKEEIYVVQRQMNFNEAQSIWNDSPVPLGEALVNDFPQVKAMTRVNYNSGVLQYGDKVFNERVAFVDDAYHELFDFPIKWGNKTTFSDPKGVVIREAIALKYFGSKNPVGETISIRFNVNGKTYLEQFEIKGVLEKAPINASFSNNILIPYQRQKAFVKDFSDWTALTNITFIQVQTPQALKELQATSDKYKAIINEANKDSELANFHFEPLTTVARHAYNVNNSPFKTSHVIGQIMLFFLAAALLLLVCFNYINITLAAAATRLKEISVRKVMGSSRQQIIWQFLTENFIICFGALIVGLLLAHYIFIPWFSTIGNVTFELNFTENPRIWLFIIGLIFLTAIGGAGYPALYISKFQPVAILKKEFKLKGKGFFRKFLISAQLVLTLITIFSTFVLLQTSKEAEQKSWGYNQHNTLVLRLPNGQDFLPLKNEIQTHKSIIDIAGSQEQIGWGAVQLKTEVAGENHDVKSLTIGPNYFNLLEVPIIDGRNFDERIESDQNQSVLVNETFRKKMNWSQAEGQTIQIANTTFQVIGEVKDFHQEDFFEAIKPMVFQMGQPTSYTFMNIRTSPGTMEETAKSLESNWKKIYPNAPYNYFFQDDVFSGYFDGYRQVNSLLSAASFMTILISIIGLFGLAMLLLSQKMKELSIRKILGANLLDIIRLINKDFFAPLIAASIIGLPISFFLMKALLGIVSPTSSVGWLPFLLTIGSLLLMVGLSLSKHIYTAVVSNPSRFLKDE